MLDQQARRKSLILKIALFATGLSGIVAEYILSTLASYFLGDSILQWTLVLSFMLFSMGAGSRLSRYFEGDLLEKFIFIEFLLSVLVSFSAIMVYLASSFLPYNDLFIYGLSISIGLMIGLEIPLVTRLNQEYESLRLNISSVMENDYYGSLLGGLFFAFVGLPYLGMTYTPFVLGLINFLVALLLYWRFRGLVQRRMLINGLSAGVFALIISGLIFAQPIILFAEQINYLDKVVYEEQSKYQKIVITQWKNDYWLFLNRNQQFSTLDEEMYHEPLVHPLMQLSKTPYDILVLGGGDGLAIRELLKYPETKSITLVDLDPAMTRLGLENEIMLAINDSAMHDPKVKVLNQDAFTFMKATKQYYDLIIIDLPDPKTVELGRMFTKEFYSLCHRQLRPEGLIITQAGSPYYAPRAYECIRRSMNAGGFASIGLHNSTLTLGEWGWIAGSKHLSAKQFKSALRKIRFDDVKTEWITPESMLLMTSFGKQDFFLKGQEVEINTIHNPVLYRYYLSGQWDEMYAR